MKTLLTAAEIGIRWACHRTTAIRILQRFGYSGTKIGSAKQSLRRYWVDDVERVEALLRLPSSVKGQKHGGGAR